MKPGEWVRRKTFGNVGWIESIREEKGVVVQYPNHTSTVHPNLLENYEAILPEVQEEAKRIFVEMALMTRDREWFMKVTAK
ncbi:hypothetical protein QNH23_06360 [Siminovitchia fortis]|uniref:IDEAL domain-containing protein n=1 Tax=Siminovitchia fortis TaxID=254758 RepID=A0A443IMB7_9BACI|nr:hypothetical protein [Siminovitchia fortis]RWR06728.1 hypothetical protein D4N35_013765 [Siminovitchia fortis]WHY82994.1 hypothetical protein QNH23_06360 [Siminovitchia fortis]